MKRILVALVIATVGATVGVIASDRVGIYGIVDKVVFEPSAQRPERVQIWGAFAVATRKDSNLYDAVQRGYLYFSAGRLYNGGPDAVSKDMTRAEWNDLKALAGTKRIVAFGSRFGQSVRVRQRDEKPQSPDAYVTGIGVTTIQPDRDYPPIRALTAHISSR
jgi:hypothetical protein